MTDEQPSRSDFEEAVLRTMKQASTDWLLGSLVRIVDGSDYEVGITLTVGGSTITGYLISGRSYFKRLGDQLAAATDIDDAEEGLFQPLIDSLYSDDTRTARDVAHIHLGDARILHGAVLIPDSECGTLWRGRLSCVSGFTIGKAEISRTFE